MALALVQTQRTPEASCNAASAGFVQIRWFRLVDLHKACLPTQLRQSFQQFFPATGGGHDESEGRAGAGLSHLP